MKRILLIAAVAGLAMVSCKKDYTCECKTTSNSPGVANATAEAKTGKMKKADAEKKCNEGDFEASSGTYKTTIDCSIKE